MSKFEQYLKESTVYKNFDEFWDDNVVPRINENKAYNYIVKITDAGPFDGGCVFYAFALQKKIGGKVVVLVNNKDVAQHAAVYKDNKLYDYDGSNSPEIFIKDFNEKEMAKAISYRNYKSGDLEDAIKGNEQEISTLTSLIKDENNE